ncbi:terminase large subunit [Vibrio phage K436]
MHNQWVPVQQAQDLKPVFAGLDVNDVIREYEDIREPMVDERELQNEELFSSEAFDALCTDREALEALDEIASEKVQRWADVRALRKHYRKFSDFLYDCMTELMGFECSEVQLDIGEFIADETRDRIMVQAQRSQAKSTIVAIYAVWKLIHNCRYRVLIISAGSDVALEIANWVIQIIMTWDMLASLRPDRHNGDRSSTKAFDINWMLKGAEKSPSVACIGITANMQGRRADLLIPDDIESSKNGLTETQRLALENLSKDFTSICQKGRICYMGTPQTVDSIYKNLPRRGYVIRVWPGRYPTPQELPMYGETLAPYVADRVYWYPQVQTGGGVNGDRGWAVDPVILDEAALQKKELDQGPEYFQLQHMLDTTLSDEGRYPLKARNLVIMPVSPEKGPGAVQWLPSPKKKLEETLTSHYHCNPELYYNFTASESMFEYEFKYVHIDPAGSGENADEVAAFACYMLHGYLFYPECIALQGGHSDENLRELAEFIARHRPNEVGVEQNMGHGAFAAMLKPVLALEYQKNKFDDLPSIEDVWESQQKELRIIETMSPLLARHRIIIDPSVIEYDRESTRRYPLEKRDTYKLIHQLVRITRDRKSLVHDDRLDVMHACARRCIEYMDVDAQDAIDEKTDNLDREFMEEWGAMTQASLNGYSCTQRFKRA